jgi:hypothetical protein
MLNFDGIDRNILEFEKCGYHKAHCNSFVGAAIIGSGVIGAGVSIYGSSQAVKAQKGAADKANALIAQTLGPYTDFGKLGMEEIKSRLPYFMEEIPLELMTQEQLEQTPGYQFVRDQGLKAVGNSAAARGLGVSGAAQKGAAAFATGHANATYKDRFSEAKDIRASKVQNRQLAYERLMGLVKTGAGAAGDQAKAMGGNIIGAGNAQAAGYNAMGGAVKDAASDIGSYFAYQGLKQPSNSGGSGSLYGEVNGPPGHPTGGLWSA